MHNSQWKSFFLLWLRRKQVSKWVRAGDFHIPISYYYTAEYTCSYTILCINYMCLCVLYCHAFWHWGIAIAAKNANCCFSSEWNGKRMEKLKKARNIRILRKENEYKTFSFLLILLLFGNFYFTCIHLKPPLLYPSSLWASDKRALSKGKMNFLFFPCRNLITHFTSLPLIRLVVLLLSFCISICSHVPWGYFRDAFIWKKQTNFC